MSTDSSDQETLVTEVTWYNSLIMHVRELRTRAVEPFDGKSRVN